MTIEQVLASPSEWVAYFGYGSLVNDKTRNAESFGMPGRLKGFRRHWSIWKASLEREAFGLGGIAALSVSPQRDAYIDGLLIFDRKDHLPNVDKREAQYDRLHLDLADFQTDHTIPRGVEAYIYVGRPADVTGSHPDYPILQSYADAVMQGFLNKFGAEGLIRFVDETSGWETPVMQDRNTPFYPRHVVLSDVERGLVEQAMEQAGAHRVPARQNSQSM